MSALVYLALTLVTIAYILYRHFTRHFNYWKERNVPGPKPIVFFGNLKESTLRKKHIGVVLKENYDSYANEKVVGVYRMTTPCLLIRDLDIIKHIMIKDFDAFTDRGIEFSKEGLGANLFHADGDTWRVLRNRFTPIFTSSKLKNMVHLMTERGDRLVDYIDSLCLQQPEQEVHSLVQKYTMATISACAFGLDVDTMHDRLDDLKKVDKMLFSPSYANEIEMLYPGLFKKLKSSLLPAFATNFFYELVRNVIAQRNGLPTNRKDFMDLILEMKQLGEIHGTKRNADDKVLTVELTDDVIAAQAFIFYVAGYETSATTMTYLLHQLALNPDVQDKLITEIDEVLQKYNGNITYDAINEMTYLSKVFSETLRKFSLVESIKRNANRDYTIPGTNITVKKGQTVLVSPMAIHQDEQYYPNPDKFDPERFSPENAADRHPCAYLPFGVGPRNCIGMRFAKVQSRVCIVKILTKFRVEPSRNTMRIMEIDPVRAIVSPKGGIYLNFVRR